MSHSFSPFLSSDSKSNVPHQEKKDPKQQHTKKPSRKRDAVPLSARQQRRQLHLSSAFNLHTGDSLMTPRARTAPVGSFRKVVRTRELDLSNIVAQQVQAISTPNSASKQRQQQHHHPPSVASFFSPIATPFSSSFSSFSRSPHHSKRSDMLSTQSSSTSDTAIQQELNQLKQELKLSRPRSSSTRRGRRTLRTSSSDNNHHNNNHSVSASDARSATGPMGVRLMKLLKVDTNKTLKHHHGQMNKWLESKQYYRRPTLTPTQIINLRSVFNVLDADNNNYVDLEELRLMVLCCNIHEQYAYTVAKQLLVKYIRHSEFFTYSKLQDSTKEPVVYEQLLRGIRIGFAAFLAILLERIDVAVYMTTSSSSLFSELQQQQQQQQSLSSTSSSISNNNNNHDNNKRKKNEEEDDDERIERVAFSLSHYVLVEVSFFKWRLHRVQRLVTMRANDLQTSAMEPWSWDLPVGDAIVNEELEQELRCGDSIRELYISGSYKTRNKHEWASNVVSTGTFSTQDVADDIQNIVMRTSEDVQWLARQAR